MLLSRYRRLSGQGHRRNLWNAVLMVPSEETIETAGTLMKLVIICLKPGVNEIASPADSCRSRHHPHGHETESLYRSDLSVWVQPIHRTIDIAMYEF